MRSGFEKLSCTSEGETFCFLVFNKIKVPKLKNTINQLEVIPCSSTFVHGRWLTSETKAVVCREILTPDCITQPTSRGVPHVILSEPRSHIISREDRGGGDLPKVTKWLYLQPPSPALFLSYTQTFKTHCPHSLAKSTRVWRNGPLGDSAANRHRFI